MISMFEIKMNKKKYLFPDLKNIYMHLIHEFKSLVSDGDFFEVIVNTLMVIHIVRFKLVRCKAFIILNRLLIGRLMNCINKAALEFHISDFDIFKW